MSAATEFGSEVRRATRTARTEAARSRLGIAGDWEIDLAIAGLGKDRRAELSAKVNNFLQLAPCDFVVGDGRLHMRAHAHSMGFHAAATFGLAEVDYLLREAAAVDYAQELLTVSMGFRVKPQERDEGRSAKVGRLRPRYSVRRLVAEKLFGVQHGVATAATQTCDRAIRQQHGDRSFVITGKVEGLTESAAAAVRSRAAELGIPDQAIDESFELLVRVDQCGTAIGALLIFLRNVGELFTLLPATASLNVEAALLPSND